jgi:cold shock CspA family protein
MAAAPVEDRESQMYQDKVLQCAACRESFVWTAGEQEFFASKGFSSPPKSCRANRRARKEQRDSGRFDERGALPDRCPWGESAGSGSRSGGSYTGGGGNGYRRDTGYGHQVVQVVEGVPMVGSITRIVRDRMFGFIRDEDGVEYYFHQSALDDDFYALTEGARVTFITASSPRGPRATNVSRV